MSLFSRRSSGGGLKTIWILAVALFTILLLLLTVGIISLRIENTLPDGKDIYFLVPRNPESHFEDTDGVWEEHNLVNIFSSTYTNGENEMTVVSQDGDKVFAPGQNAIYSFCMVNGGNMAVRYDFQFSFVLKIAGKEANASSFPIAIRLTDTNGKYLVGAEEKGLSIPAGVAAAADGVLGASSYEQFTLNLEWEFEGNDELDTLLGNEATKSDIELTFTIDSYAEEHEDSRAQGGVWVSETSYEDYEFGGQIRWEWFAILLALLAICTLYLIIFRV